MIGLIYCIVTILLLPYPPYKDQTELGCEGHGSGIHCLTSEAGEETKLYPTWYRPNNWPMLSQSQATPIDALGDLDHIPKLMSEPSGQFQQTETPLSMWTGSSLMPLSNENRAQLVSGTLESTQPYMLEVEKNICCELVSGPPNKDSVTSISPQVSPFSEDYEHYITITTPSFTCDLVGLLPQVIPASWPSIIVFCFL